MLTYFVAFALAFAVSAALTPVLRARAPIIGGVDRAHSTRKVHVGSIPRIGGVAIVVGFFVPLVGLFIYTNDISGLFLRDTSKVVALFTGGLAIALLGLYDDLHGAGARLKFTVQVAVAILVYQLGFRVEYISHPFAAQSLSLVSSAVPWTSLHVNLSGPFTVLWIVGVINAMNLIDGLDGLAGGVALISIGLVFTVAFNRPAVLMCLFSASLGGAVMGFLLYNFNPATIFMGDTGSMFLGFVLATSSIETNQKGAAAVAMFVPIVSLGLPIADTLLAMLRRWIRGRPLFSADKEHIHHRLLAIGFTHRQAVLVLYGVCLLLAAAALGLAYASRREAELIAGALGLFVTFVLRRLGYLRIDPESARSNALSRERNTRLRNAARAISDELREASGLDEVWSAVKQAGPVLHASEVTLSLLVHDDGGEQHRKVLTWRPHQIVETDASADRSMADCAVRLELAGRLTPGSAGRRSLGALITVWADGRREVDRDDELLLERLADHLETALRRLDSGDEQGAETPVLLSVDGGGQVVEFRRLKGG